MAAQRQASVEAAQYQVAQAEARVTQSRSALFPQISADISQTGRTFNTATFGIDFPSSPGEPPLFNPNGQVEGPVRLLDLRGAVRQPIVDFSTWRQIDRAQAGVDVTEAQTSAIAEQAAFTATVAYLATSHADERYRNLLADKELAQDLLQIARAQLKAGVGVDLDVTRAEARLAAVQARLVAAENDRNRSRLDLLRTLNLPLDTRIELTDSLSNLAPTDLQVQTGAAVERALQNRPELKVLRETVDATRAQMSAIRAERYPTLGLVADDGFIGKTPAHLLNTYDWGFSVTVPLFSGNRVGGQLEEQRARLNELDVRYQDQLAQIRYEVRKARGDLASAKEQVEAARTRLRLAEQEVAQAQQRFQTGVAGNADVITAMLSLSDARMMLTNAFTAYQSARVNLARSEGIVTALP